MALLMFVRASVVEPSVAGSLGNLTLGGDLGRWAKQSRPIECFLFTVAHNVVGRLCLALMILVQSHTYGG